MKPSTGTSSAPLIELRNVSAGLVVPSTASLDGSGRVLLPAPLREFAQLDKHVVLAGQGNKFEIWDEEVWSGNRERWQAELLTDDGNLADELAGLTL